MLKFFLSLFIVITAFSIMAMKTQANDIPIQVFKSPYCGCCSAWGDHLTENGFHVVYQDRQDMEIIKQMLGVPTKLASCHTGLVGGYVIEGHVPAQDILRLLSEKPDARGLAVPGMPIGSPGMEQGARKDPYDVIVFDENSTEVFASHPE